MPPKRQGSTRAKPLPPGEPRSQTTVASESKQPESTRAGLKASTVGTTLYLLPDESWRLKELAVTLRVSMHELILQGLDRMLAENGMPPIKRYVPDSVKRPKVR